MNVSREREEAKRLLRALENGGTSAMDAAVLAEDVDPVLLYVVVSFLRAAHPASDPAARGILERVVRLTSASPALVKRHREGERDPISRWLESEYDYGSFRGRGDELIDLVVDKLDS